MRSKSIQCLLFLLSMCLLAGAANAQVIYSDTFDGDGSSGINGTIPTVGTIPWASKADFIQTDGSIMGGGANGAWAGAAYLPFNPVAGEVYSLMLDINHTGNNPSALKYIAIGFAGLGADEGKLDTGYRFPQNDGIGYYFYGDNGEITLWEKNNTQITGTGSYIGNQWVTLMIVLDTTGDGSSFTVEFFLNGESITLGGPHTIERSIDDINYCGIGSYGTRNGDSPVGTMIDNFILMHGLPNPGLATAPRPTNQAADVLLDTDLNWKSGKFVAEHDVYFGTSFEDVNSATPTSDVFQTTLPAEQTRFELDTLDYGVTYFWRIDEVNDLNPDSPWKGKVWSFEAEPATLVLEAEKIAVTPSSVGSDSQGNPLDANDVVNGAGLDPNGLHDTNIANMWSAAPIELDPDPSIEFVFDKPYRLAEMRVWNHNSVDEALNDGYSIKDVNVYYLDGTEWVKLADITQFAQAPGSPDYAGELFPLNIVASGIRIEAVSPYATITIPGVGTFPKYQYGLSEVAFNYIPNTVREMNPVDGRVEVDPTSVLLSWRPGREAVSHNVYLSTDINEVLDRTATMTSRTEPNMVPEIDLSQTYYWCVDEVNDLADPSVWPGPVQSLTTADYLIVDDFDAYTDDWGNMVFQSWTDGLGWEDPEGNTGDGNGSGSGVGHWPPPTMETTTVRSGQSMVLAYGLDDKVDSYTTLDLSDDWSQYGIKSLSLWFHGGTENVGGQLYVKVNGQRFNYLGEATDIQTAGWFPFTVNLEGVTTVNSLTIGVEGGSGTIFVDDIRLYPLESELIIPVMPDNTNLALHLPFDGDYQDVSGNNRHGTVVGDPIFVDGAVGQALELDGTDDYVAIEGYKGVNADRTDPNNPVQQPFSIACWFKTLGAGEMVTWGTNAGRQRMTFRIDAGRLRSEHGAGAQRGITATCNDGEWHHAAIVVNEGAAIVPPETVLYLDGQAQDTVQITTVPYELQADLDVHIGNNGPQGGTRFFPGALDDVRIYERVLSAAEVAGLAGKTAPIYKPF